MKADVHDTRIPTKPTVFVGYRFTDEDESIAKKFLNLFELEELKCISGKPAQATGVDQKVKELIDKSDGVIIIFTREQKLAGRNWTTSAWLNDEKAYAMGKGKPLVLFFDNCISDSKRKGIHGDLEYVEFDRECLDDAILRAIPYLRDFRRRILTRK